jgi:GT2 family glycosyltransferase
VILNWNRRSDTLACLESLAALDEPGVDISVIVVDNGSSDGSVAAVASAFPSASILALPRNVGFSAGMNAGLELALRRGFDWSLVLNNDTIAEPGLLSALLGAFEPEDVGMAAPTVVYADDPGRVWPSAGWRRGLTLAAFDTTADPPSDEPYDVDWATACCLMVRREVWEKVGLFDDRYAFYYEDHDLCIRARSLGWRIRHVPRARIRHRVSASTGEGSPGQAFLLARSSVPYYLAHTRGWHRAFIVCYRAISLVLTLLRAAAARRPRSGLAYLAGLTHGLRDVLSGGAGSGAAKGVE